MSQTYPKELGSITIRLLHVDAKIEQRLVIQKEALCKHTITVLSALGDGLKKSALVRIGQPSRKQSTFLKTTNDHFSLQLYALSTTQKIRRICECASVISARNKNQ